MEPIHLKELRRIHGMRQQDLAEELNISQQSISRYENGQHYPDVLTLIHLANYFDVPLDYLVGRKWPKGEVPEEYITEAMSYEPAEKDGPLVSGRPGAEALIKADIMHIVSASKASEALSQDSIDLSELSPKHAAQMREIYNTMLSAEKSKTK